MSPWQRLLAFLILLAVLVGLFVLAGTIQPDPATNNFPDTSDIHENPDRYLDQRVTVGGTVVATDPLTVKDEALPGETIIFIIDTADTDAAVGDHLWVHGRLQPDAHINADTVIHRNPWEAQYMYVVSFLAGLWVLARLLNHWTIDTATWTVVPRAEPLFEVR